MAKGTRLAVERGGRRTAGVRVAEQAIRQTSLRWPDDVHRWLVNKARDDHASINEVVLGMIRQHMAKAR